MLLNAYLGFDGNCAEAMRFYERALGAKLEMMMKFGDSPMCGDMPPGSAERIMHARLALAEGVVIMAGDGPPGKPYEGMKNISLTLSYDRVEEATKAFNALAEGANVTMPLQKTFWAETCGMLTDRFGTPWIVNGALQKVG